MLKIRRLTRPGLSPVDLEVAERECIAIGGPSGAGKSIFMRAVADLDPNEGEVSLSGLSRESLPAPQWRRQVVYVPAEAGWWADRVAGHFPDPDFAAPLMIRLGLPAEALEWEVARLSTGEKQRLALTRALLIGPRVLLLDEPTSGLDPETATKVEAILHEHLADGAAIILITHDDAQAKRMASRRLVMEGGVLTPAPEPEAETGKGSKP
ncbi:MAG: ATP-binding cassette domain-containing protein [Rhodospirillales bacterium]